MSKLTKRLRKLVKNPENAIVVGQGFGQLDIMLNLFKTIFIFSWNAPKLKAKNLIFRENFNDLNPMSEISMVFFDRDQVHHLETMMAMCVKNKSVIVIEGNDVIGRNLSLPLYTNNYRAVDQQEFYHVWKLQQ
jgi:hypothetical protein